jgi:hypothetical protein
LLVRLQARLRGERVVELEPRRRCARPIQAVQEARMSRRMIPSICCICLCLAVARAEVTAASAAALSAQARLPGAETIQVELVAALGRAWGDRALQDLLAAFRIEAKPPVVRRDDTTTFLQSFALGIELTFRRVEAVDVPLREPPSGSPVLSNIRLHGPGSSTHREFKGELPFGLRFGDSKDALIARFGPPDIDRRVLGNVPLMRWDTEPYALFVQLDEAGTMRQLDLQLPVVATNRPGFEAR